MIEAEELKWLGETPRMAAYRVGANGRSAAQIGLARGLLRHSAAPTPRSVPVTRSEKANATNAKPRDRVKVVADAVANDPALKGKAEAALYMLADADLAGLTGEAIVKSLKAGMTVTPPAMVTTTKPTTAPKRSDALGGGNAPTAESKASWDRAYDRLFGRKA